LPEEAATNDFRETVADAESSQSSESGDPLPLAEDGVDASDGDEEEEEEATEVEEVVGFSNATTGGSPKSSSLVPLSPFASREKQGRLRARRSDAEHVAVVAQPAAIVGGARRAGKQRGSPVRSPVKKKIATKDNWMCVICKLGTAKAFALTIATTTDDTRRLRLAELSCGGACDAKSYYE
jgi:hypothetical protein